MAHLASRCRCGRKMRLPKGSTYGDKWTCWKCGTTYTLSTHGQHAWNEASRPPPPQAGSGGGSGITIWHVIGGVVLLLILLRGCG